MFRYRNSFCGLILVSLLAGCFTLPQGAGSGAGYVGDRASVELDEVVVSILSNEGSTFRNLHVAMSAIINPRKVSMYDPYDVRSLVKRLGPRVGSRLVQSILEMGAVKVGDLPAIRERLNRDAQSVIDEAVRGWGHADEYEIRIVVGSLYFTDGSVGRQNVPRPFWW